MAPTAGMADPSLRSDLEAAHVVLVQDDAAAREPFEALHARALAAGDGTVCALCAAGMVVGYAIEFADFRGLARWIHRLEPHLDAGASKLPDLSPTDRLRLDSAWITLPSLDGQVGFDAPMEAAARRAAQALAGVTELCADERMLHTKMLLDYHSIRHDVPGIEQVMAFGHELARRPGVSPTWQCRWWLLALLNHEYFGQGDAARQAREQVQDLAARHGLRAPLFELACIEMSAALKADDLDRAERLYRWIDTLRPAVRPGRLPHGLRAQALVLARRGEYVTALDRVQLLLALCADVEVPRRDQGAYEVLRAYCLAATQRWPEALSVLDALRPDQQGEQGEVLAVIRGTVEALRALDEGLPQAGELCGQVLTRCAALRFNRFLLPLPAAASRLVEAGLDRGVVPEFLWATVHDRRLVPSDPVREHWPWRLTLHALGPLILHRDGLPLSGPAAARAQRKPLELLRLLAAHGGGPLSQDAVIAELWPSPEAEAPKPSFEMAVSRLRKLLGLPDLVRVADGQVALDRSRVWIDVAAFETLCERGDDASLQRALELYRAPLLGAESLDGLLHTARGRLALRHGHAVRTLAGRCVQRDDAAGAAALYQRALAHEPLAEALHRGLIEAQALQGEVAEALTSYRRLCDLLARGLGISPSAQTEALVQAVRAGRLRPSAAGDP
jgi:DNA-binding SARP family transcriptional activator